MDTTLIAKGAQLDLLTELDRICRKHDIPYFLVGGTLIGAIRHDGFIPWDDDIDLAMLRSDYERFRRLCPGELDDAYMLHDWYEDPASPHSFLKLKIRGTHYTEAFSANCPMNDAIFIDIFPYDNAPDGALARKLHGARRYLVKKILLLRCGFEIAGDSKAKKLLYGALEAASRIRSVEQWKRAFEKNQQRYNDRKTDTVVNLSGAYSYSKECKPRAMLEKLTTHRFETGMFSVPEDYDGYLTSSYGDYMKLPPEEQRVGIHGVSRVELGGYQLRSRLSAQVHDR